MLDLSSAASGRFQSANDPRQHRGYGLRMLVAVFGDAHAHAEALDAVIAAAEDCAAPRRCGRSAT